MTTLQIIDDYQQPQNDEVDFNWTTGYEVKFTALRTVARLFERAALTALFVRERLGGPYRRAAVPPFKLEDRTTNFTRSVTRVFVREAMTRTFLWEKTDGS